MNVYANRGDKITVTTESATNGRKDDRQNVQLYLEIGGIYTVEYTSVGGWHTDVYIQEVPGIAFNSVNFVDVETSPIKRPIDAAIDKVHLKYGSVLSKLAKS